MNLAHESLLRYQGLNDMDGVCHIRVYEQPGALPIVIAGALDENPGTSTATPTKAPMTPRTTPEHS